MWHVGFDMCSILIWPPLEKKKSAGSVPFDLSVIYLRLVVRGLFIVAWDLFLLIVLGGCVSSLWVFLFRTPNGSLLLLGMGFP